MHTQSNHLPPVDLFQVLASRERLTCPNRIRAVVAGAEHNFNKARSHKERLGRAMQFVLRINASRLSDGADLSELKSDLGEAYRHALQLELDAKADLEIVRDEAKALSRRAAA